MSEATEPETYRFSDDGETPNNPHWPLVIYRSALDPDRADPASTFETAFAKHRWTGSWRNGIYPFNHFHSSTHEVLGIARGSVDVQFGGAGGRAIALSAGDVVIQPAGTGHKRLKASDDLLVVGAYPEGSSYDQPHATKGAHDEALASIAAVPLPPEDPVFGAAGPLLRLWSKQGR